MTAQGTRERSSGRGPVQTLPPPAKEDMPSPKKHEDEAGRAKDAQPSGRRRGSVPPVDGFSAEAIPLRPAAERSEELEREERLRLMMARRLPRLPAVGRRPRAVAVGIAVGLAVMVVGGSIAILTRGGAPARDTDTSGVDQVARRPQAPPHADPLASVPEARNSHVVGRQVGSRRASIRRGRDEASVHRRSGRGRRRTGPRRAQADAATAALATAAQEEPVATPIPEPVPEEGPAPEPTPVVEPQPEPAPAPEPAPPTSATEEEPTQTQEQSAVERQFGFER